MKKIILLWIVCSVALLAQNNAAQITQNLVEKLNSVKSYTAEVTINIDVDFVNINERKAAVKYEYPDKFEIKSDGFALLPKNGTDMEYMQLLRNDHTAIFQNTETIRGIETSVIKVVPLSSESKVVLAEMWINTQNNILMKMKTYTRSEGSYEMHFYYENHPYDLPDKIEVKFEIQNSMIPTYMSGEVSGMGEKQEEGTTTGTVIMDYENYNVTGK